MKRKFGTRKNKSVLMMDTPETCSDCILNVCGDCVTLEEPLTNDEKVLNGFDTYESKLKDCPLKEYNDLQCNYG